MDVYILYIFIKLLFLSKGENSYYIVPKHKFQKIQYIE